MMNIIGLVENEWCFNFEMNLWHYPFMNKDLKNEI